MKLEMDELKGMTLKEAMQKLTAKEFCDFLAAALADELKKQINQPAVNAPEGA